MIANWSTLKPSLCRPLRDLEQYIALDQPHIAYSAKTALQQMPKPTKLMLLRVVRVGRYLKNNPRLVWKFPYQQQPKSIDVFVDADFAGRERMLRSTSGVAEYHGRAPIEFASSTQIVRALSTGEADFYAITKGSADSSQSQAILKGFGCDGGSRCLVGRECWHRDRIAPRLWTTEAS